MHTRTTGICSWLPAVLYSVVLRCLLVGGGLVWMSGSGLADRPPNIVLILCDNLGYGDIGCYGSQQHRTPFVDQLASEGLRLTSFYSASGVCTPSRAALMTGCYPRRVGMDLTDPDGAVLRPVSPNGLHPRETTIAEILKAKGYATACIGKWHLGDQPRFLPTRQGFDLYFGIPYSDDMTAREGKPWPPLPLMDGEQVIEAPVDRNTLTKRYTQKTIDFIRSHRDQPFFVYLPHAMPGSTRAPYASEDFQGRSANGPWGDSVEEIDWSTGQIMSVLQELDLEDDTLVIWTSDNGAPRRNPVQGSNSPLGGWGYSTAEGGMRVPCIVRWPGHIPRGSVSDEVTTMMDWLPTFAAVVGGTVDWPIDGYDITALLQKPATTGSPYSAFFYYYRDQLQAVRSGQWKLYLPSRSRQVSLRGDAKLAPAELYNLDSDIGETQNVLADHPDVAAKLTADANRIRNDLGTEGRPGPGVRAVGRVLTPQPQIKP